MGRAGTPEGVAARERATAVRRADHIMEIAGRLVDGRSGASGAQYINTAKGMQQRSNNADFAGTTGSIRVTAAGGIAKGTEILMPYGSVYWKQRDTDARHDARYGRRDARRGGMIAYTVHTDRRIAYVEEVVRSWESTGHKLQTGHALFSRMLDAVRRDVDEVHLIVRRDNVHARNLYERIGFSEVPWEIYEPMSNEMYMVAHTSDMTRMLARAWNVPTRWEVEIGACTMRLRVEDRMWARQMYEEEHGGTRKWTQHHAHQAAHILIWDGTGVGVAVGVARRGRECAHGTEARVERRGNEQGVCGTYAHSVATGTAQQNGKEQPGAAPGSKATATDGRTRTASDGSEMPGSSSAHARVNMEEVPTGDGSSRRGAKEPQCDGRRVAVAAVQPHSDARARCEETEVHGTTDSALSARTVPGRATGQVRTDVVQNRRAAPGGDAEEPLPDGDGDGGSDHARRGHIATTSGRSGGDEGARSGTSVLSAGGGGGRDARDGDDIRQSLDVTRRNLVSRAVAGEVVHLDDGFGREDTRTGSGGGDAGAGESDVEETTEAEYKRGVKRKRGRRTV